MDQINVTHSKRMTFMYARLLLKVTRPEPKGKTMQELWRRTQNRKLITNNNKFSITYGVLVLVGVQTCVNNTTKQILIQGFNRHDQVDQKVRKWHEPGKSWPAPVPSSCHEELRQRRSSEDRALGRRTSHSWSRRSPRG